MIWVSLGRVAAYVAAVTLVCSQAVAQQAPAITSASSYVQDVTAATTFTVIATGTPTPEIKIIAGSRPSGVTFIDNGDGTATFAGTPAPGSAGTYNLTLRASNGVGGNAKQEFTFTVNKLAPPAALNIVPNRTAFAGELFFLQMDLGALSPLPTGTVTFTEGAEVLGVRNVSGGQAVIAKRRPIGTHEITATYSGDINYEAATISRDVEVTAAFRREVRVNTTTAGTQRTPSVAMYRRGYMVVWASEGVDGSGYGIVGQRLGFGGGKIDGEFAVNTTTGGNQIAPKIAPQTDGGFIVAWQSNGQVGRGPGIYAQLFTGAAVMRGREIKVDNNGRGDRTQPAIAVLADDGFVVTWTREHPNGGGLDVYARRFGEDGSSIGGEFLVNTRTTGDQSAPAIAGLADGGFVIVWQSLDRGRLAVFGQRFDAAGEKVGEEFRISKTLIGNQSVPGIANLLDGGFVVVWQSDLQNGSGTDIYVQRFRDDGTRIGQETRANTTTADDQSEPVIASFQLGGFVVVWTSQEQDGSGKGVYAQVFHGTGTKADVEFRIGNTTAGDQWQPAVAGCVISEFRVAWVSPDAEGTGVFSQLFLVPIVFGAGPIPRAEASWVPGANCVRR